MSDRVDTGGAPPLQADTLDFVPKQYHDQYARDMSGKGFTLREYNSLQHRVTPSQVR